MRAKIIPCQALLAVICDRVLTVCRGSVSLLQGLRRGLVDPSGVALRLIFVGLPRVRPWRAIVVGGRLRRKKPVSAKTAEKAPVGVQLATILTLNHKRSADTYRALFTAA